jgi:hypothetical protein
MALRERSLIEVGAGIASGALAVWLLIEKFQSVMAAKNAPAQPTFNTVPTPQPQPTGAAPQVGPVNGYTALFQGPVSPSGQVMSYRAN